MGRKVTTGRNLRNGVFRAKHKQQKPARIVSNTKFWKKQKKYTTANTTKLERHTENVCERMSKDVRKHRYRLPRATLRLKLLTRMIHPTRHHAHQPLHKNIRLTGSETKTYGQYSLNYRFKNSKTDLIEQKMSSNFDMS